MRYSRGLRNSQKVMVRFLSVASFSGFLVGAIASPARSQPGQGLPAPGTASDPR